MKIKAPLSKKVLISLIITLALPILQLPAREAGTHKNESAPAKKEEYHRLQPHKMHRPASVTTPAYRHAEERRNMEAVPAAAAVGHPIERDRALERGLQDENFLLQGTPAVYPTTAYPTTVVPTTTDGTTTTTPTTTTTTPTTTTTTGTSSSTPASGTVTPGRPVGGNDAQQQLQNIYQNRLQNMNSQQ